MPDPLQLLETQAAATRRIVESVPDAEFEKPSPGCPGWRVQDVVAHLTTGAEMFAWLARGTISGDQWMEVRQRRLAENSALAPADLKRRYVESDASLLDTFRTLTPEQLQEKRSHPALGEVPVAQLVHMRISEATVHGWDIASAVDPNARLEAPATPSVLPLISSVCPSWFVTDSIDGVRRTYRFVVRGAVNEERTLTIADGKATWSDGGGSPDATMSLDAGDFVLLLSGRLSSERLISSGRAQTSGDVEAAKQLSTLYKAYGGR